MRCAATDARLERSESSMACAAASNSIASVRSTFATTVQHLSAEAFPIDT